LKTPREIVRMFKQRCLVVNAVNKVLTSVTTWYYVTTDSSRR